MLMQKVSAISNMLRECVGVQTVFGEPVVRKNRTIIPVSRATQMFGGGIGDTQKSDSVGIAEGLGGGGIIRTRPLGVYEITDTRTKFIPAIDIKGMVQLGGIALATICWLTIRASKKSSS